MSRWITARRVINMINLSTPLGLALARSEGARLAPGPRGLTLAHSTRPPRIAPRAPAVTVGNVVLLRLSDEALAARPRMLDHEGRHATQWAFCLGPLGFVPLYLLASIWSWARCRDFALRNVFEVRADLFDGGYVHEPPERGPAG